MKLLKRVRLINWHRFPNETIELGNAVLLSGENGTGKSTVLDAIQFVITCSKANFNKAAHEKGKRNLNSYIRCKTGKETHPYERTGELSAHICLEFFDESRKQSFLIGVVMDSQSEEKEPNTAWYLMEDKTFSDELFFNGRQIKGIQAFRTNKGIRKWAPTIGEAKAMILSRFGRLNEKFFSLIPKAMAFKPIHDIKEFVYSYVLDEREVNIDTLRENVRSYQELERMLEDVRRRIAELEIIRNSEAETQRYIRLDRSYEYYIARAEQEILEEQLVRKGELIKATKQQLEEINLKINSEEEQKRARDEIILALRAELENNEEYRALHELERREETLNGFIRQDRQDVEKLKESAKRAAHTGKALSDAIKKDELAEGRLMQDGDNADGMKPDAVTGSNYSNPSAAAGSNLPHSGINGATAAKAAAAGSSQSTANKAAHDAAVVIRKVNSTLAKINQETMEAFAAYLEQLKVIEKCEYLSELSQGADRAIELKRNIYDSAVNAAAQYNAELQHRKDELDELKHKVKELKEHRLIYPKGVNELRQRVQDELLKLGKRSEARVLCEMLEISNPAWQNAVEGYLNTQRFYIIVEPEDYDVAVSVYDKLREAKKVYGVGLINTGKLEQYDEVPEGSLAETVTAKNIWAKRYINMILGKVHRCQSYQELKNYPTAITRQCMKYQNHVVSAIKPEIYETPYIGAEAIKRQLIAAEQELREQEEIFRLLKERTEAKENLRKYAESDADRSVRDNIRYLEQLRLHDNELKNCREQIRKLKENETLIQKSMQLTDLRKEAEQISGRINALYREQGVKTEAISRDEEEREELSASLLKQSTFAEQLGEALWEDYNDAEAEYNKTKKDKDPYKFKENYERQRKANQTLRDKAESEMISAMRAYKAAHDFGAPDSLAGFSEFAAEYDKLKNSKLLEYEDKVYRARNAAEEEFREQFLSKLQENIRQARQDFKELNRALSEISFDREHYEFLYEPRSSMKRYYTMIMDDRNIGGEESIFGASFMSEHKEVIDELFSKLALNDGDETDKVLEQYTDYRTYMDYDIRIVLPDGSYMLYSKVSAEKSGGETQSPFYITVAASFIQLYKNSIGGDAIGIMMMDEAFNNMDDERMGSVLEFLTNPELKLQLIIAAPPGKIQDIGKYTDKILLTMPDGKYSFIEDFTHEKL